jgi:tetratricopeptide (TPR) repeat protein
VRGWISIGAAERARDVAHARADAAERPGPWRIIEADALRALGRYAEAADVYDAAARLLPAADAAHAGYLAAYLRFERTQDPAGALASLDATAADGPGAPLEERALALRAHALFALGRTDEARAAAHRYLERFPDGGQAESMRTLAGR